MVRCCICLAVFLVTLKPIRCGEEILVYYGEEYHRTVLLREKLSEINNRLIRTVNNIYGSVSVSLKTELSEKQNASHFTFPSQSQLPVMNLAPTIDLTMSVTKTNMPHLEVWHYCRIIDPPSVYTPYVYTIDAQ